MYIVPTWGSGYSVYRTNMGDWLLCIQNLHGGVDTLYIEPTWGISYSVYRTYMGDWLLSLLLEIEGEVVWEGEDEMVG